MTRLVRVAAVVALAAATAGCAMYDTDIGRRYDHLRGSGSKTDYCGSCGSGRYSNAWFMPYTGRGAKHGPAGSRKGR
jgi:hypothetical protein